MDELDYQSSLEAQDPNKNFDLLQCTFEDKEVILGIREATINLALTPFSFSYFNLGFSDYDRYILDKLSINELSGLINCDDLLNLEQDVTNFIKSLSLKDENRSIANYIAYLITRVVNNIIDASDYENAWVYIKSDVNPNGYGKYGPHTYCEINEIPDWHIDKNLFEMTDPYNKMAAFFKQHTYIITLKGNSTLYYKAQESIHTKFLSYTEDLDVVYSHKDLSFSSPLLKAFDKPYSIHSTSIGKGSIHIAGKSYGTIHASPFHHERLVVVVIPQFPELITKYYQFIEDINKKWLDDLLSTQNKSEEPNSD